MLALRSFLGFKLSEQNPNHSMHCRIRQRFDVELHQAVFTLVLEILAERGLLKGKTLGNGATTLEANAALRSLVRRDDGTAYEDFLIELAKESGIETPTRAELAKVDKKRPKNGSNDDWKHPHDPDAKITKMKDGRTHLAHKSEHAVDMTSGAVVAVTLHGGTEGDTRSIYHTLAAATRAAAELGIEAAEEVVADKGYHSNEVVRTIEELGMRSYISEPDRGRRRWKGKAKEKKAVYANRRRMKGERGKALGRLRGERVERSFAHFEETGDLRRCRLRGTENNLKRHLAQAMAFNLALAMRSVLGAGTPRGLAGLRAELWRLRALLEGLARRLGGQIASIVLECRQVTVRNPALPAHARRASMATYSTGC